MMNRHVDGTNMRTAALIGAALCLITTTLAHADATLSLQRIGSGPLLPGQQVQVVLRMTNVPPATPAAGFQAFLSFNSTQMTFISGTYTTSPFGLPILTPIAASGSNINLAAGVDAFVGQPPSSADADLATLTFQVNTQCGLASVAFRPHDPPTRLSDVNGVSIQPLALLDLPPDTSCIADVFPSGVIDVNDLLTVMTTWGACPAAPDCCAGDADSNSTVDVNDLLAVITTWGPCP